MQTFQTTQKADSNKPTFQFNVTVSLTALIALLLTIYVNRGDLTTIFPNTIPTPTNVVDVVPFKNFKAESIKNGVNVRSEPSLNSSTIHNKLYKGIIVTVKEKSTETSKINIKGTLHTDHWYRVEFTYKKNGEKFLGKGWVFGYFIKQVRNPDIA